MKKIIGIVQGVLGIRWYDCVVTGQESHAGPTPMRLRQDALQVATRIMQEVVAIAGRSEEGRGTVGRVQVYPNSRNVVPGRSLFRLICAISAMRWWMRWTASCGRLSPGLSGRAA
jgi:N-carbamoyl-L-amino-acid hydrolase